MLTLALEKAREANAVKINRINLVVGDLSGVVPDCVRFYFEHISKDTMASGADLVFATVGTKLHCRNCNQDFTPDGLEWLCPDCHESGVEITSGRECYMESIEVE